MKAVTLAVGARVMVNYNCRKQVGRVNGAMGTVHHIGQHIIVIHLAFGPRTKITRRRAEGSRVMGFPIALAYAVPIAKMQGRTLSAAALLPDLRAPGLAHTAIAGVRSLKTLFWIEPPTRAWFVPQRGVRKRRRRM